MLKASQFFDTKLIELVVLYEYHPEQCKDFSLRPEANKILLTKYSRSDPSHPEQHLFTDSCACKCFGCSGYFGIMEDFKSFFNQSCSKEILAGSNKLHLS